MRIPTAGLSRRRSVLTILIVAVAATVFLFARAKPSNAEDEKSGQRTARISDTLPNYDIRTAKGSLDEIAHFRTRVGKTAADTADSRERMAAAEVRLRRRVPTLKVDVSPEMQVPEVISPDVRRGRAFLKRGQGRSRPATLKGFLAENPDLIDAEIEKLKVTSDQESREGKLDFVELKQELNGIPVFRGTVKAGFSADGSIVRIVNNLAPGLNEAEIQTYFGDPTSAVRKAAEHVGDEKIANAPLAFDPVRSTENKVYFGRGLSAPSALKMYFPIEPGVAVPAWRVMVWEGGRAYYVIVDAETGTMLWRRMLTDDQSQPATYNIYANPNAMVNIAHSPFPLNPGPSSPNGVQAGVIPRALVTRVGNEPPYSFNNLGWITDGNNALEGNNVEAGLDREGPNLGDLDPAAIDPGSIPTGSPNRVFNFPIEPGIPTNPAQNTGESPLPAGQNPLECLEEGTSAVPTDFQKAVVTQLFYITNVFHDEMYRVGFNESAGNFQNDNFGRGGLGDDRISAQAQDCSGVNNANFTTPADGERPQMQMYIWQAPNPDIDGSLDADVIIHELGHGVSNRLHGDSTGLMLDIAKGMGEGWSDFFAHSLLSEPTDPIDGVYTIGAYDTYLYSTVGFNNHYYGIRRFPTAIMSSVGGPDGRPHNPLTFRDIDSTQMDITDGAYNARFHATADSVHAIGEFWNNTLWEIRARMIQRLGWEVGNRRMLQFVIDGMKLAPIGPTPVSERDALIAAIFASGTEADLADAWAGFAVRGLGTAASVTAVGGISIGGGGAVRVDESFDLPNIVQAPYISVSDAPGDGDGYPEPGETIAITIPLTNSTGRTATSVSARIATDYVDYGTMSGISSATRTLNYTIPSCAACGGVFSLNISIESSLGPVSFTRSIFIGAPGATTPAQNFDGVAAPALPVGWAAVPVLSGINFVNATSSPDSAPNTMYARNPTTVGGGTDLTSPPISVTSTAATLNFRNSYNTENTWDGGVLEISIAGGEYQDIITAGGTFIQNGYNGPLRGGRNNPLSSRTGWTGNSNGFLTTVIRLPEAANGKIVTFKWRFGADDNTAGTGADPGWRVDTITLSGAGFVSNFECSVQTLPVFLSGQLRTPQGLPLRNTVVALTDACGVTRRSTTSSFGFYQFLPLPPGGGYVLTASSKRYRFSPRIVDLTNSVSGFDLTGQE